VSLQAACGAMKIARCREAIDLIPAGLNAYHCNRNAISGLKILK
jgi:hypothetical protein